MQNQLFRKKSLERVSSPEQLQDYMRVTSPAMWMVLGAVIVLLAGLLILASVGHLETTLPAQAGQQAKPPVKGIERPENSPAEGMDASPGALWALQQGRAGDVPAADRRYKHV